MQSIYGVVPNRFGEILQLSLGFGWCQLHFPTVPKQTVHVEEGRVCSSSPFDALIVWALVDPPFWVVGLQFLVHMVQKLHFPS